MDKLVQEKNANMEAIHVTSIPTVTTIVSYTSIAPMATTVPVATTVPSTSATYSTTTSTHPSDEAGKLIKAMQDMSI